MGEVEVSKELECESNWGSHSDRLSDVNVK